MASHQRVDTRHVKASGAHLGPITPEWPRDGAHTCSAFVLKGCLDMKACPVSACLVWVQKDASGVSAGVTSSRVICECPQLPLEDRSQNWHTSGVFRSSGRSFMQAELSADIAHPLTGALASRTRMGKTAESQTLWDYSSSFSVKIQIRVSVKSVFLCFLLLNSIPGCHHLPVLFH